MEIRPVQEDSDLESVVGILNAVYPDDPITAAEFSAWGEQAGERSDLVAEQDGTIVGVARAFFKSRRPNPWLHIWIPAAERRRGIGSALYADASAWARSKGYAGFEAWVRENAEEGIAFAGGLGFEETGRERGLTLDLTAIEAPDVQPPAGIELTTWADRPEVAPGLHEVWAEAAVDIPGEEDEEVEPFEDWLRNDMQSAGDRAEGIFVALAGDEVVGYAKFHFSALQRTTLYHDMTGVKRAWRGRGIASALKATQVRWAKEKGYEELRTSNEERNAPIRKLNQRFGYRRAPGRIHLRGPLADT